MQQHRLIAPRKHRPPPCRIAPRPREGRRRRIPTRPTLPFFELASGRHGRHTFMFLLPGQQRRRHIELIAALTHRLAQPHRQKQQIRHFTGAKKQTRRGFCLPSAPLHLLVTNFSTYRKFLGQFPSFSGPTEAAKTRQMRGVFKCCR